MITSLFQDLLFKTFSQDNATLTASSCLYILETFDFFNKNSMSFPKYFLSMVNLP